MRKVLMDHDGGAPDDYMAAALLLTMPNVETLGFVVTPADCYQEPATRATRKILGLLGREGLPVARSEVQGRNPFPEAWRQYSYTFDDAISAVDPGVAVQPASGVPFMAQTLRQTVESVTLLVTGPLSTVAAVIKREPQLTDKIESIIWMGGALDVPGNVSSKTEPSHDGSAEWNAYWDPDAVQTVWQTEIPIVLCPLDVTNKVPLTRDFVRILHAQAHHPLSRIAAAGYELIIDLPEVCLWDVLATVYLERSELFWAEVVPTAVVTRGKSQGRIVRRSGARPVRVLLDVDAPAVLRYVLKQWER